MTAVATLIIETVTAQIKQSISIVIDKKSWIHSADSKRLKQIAELLNKSGIVVCIWFNIDWKQFFSPLFLHRRCQWQCACATSAFNLTTCQLIRFIFLSELSEWASAIVFTIPRCCIWLIVFYDFSLEFSAFSQINNCTYIYRYNMRSFRIQSITFRLQQFTKRDLITISIYFTPIYLYPVQKRERKKLLKINEALVWFNLQ